MARSVTRAVVSRLGLGIYDADRKILYRAALKAAHSELNDVEAGKSLREQIQLHPRGARSALSLLGLTRDEFASDRAYRLLEAAIKNVSVEPVRGEMTDLFSREEKLGRLPLRDAFASLEQLEPALKSYEQVSTGAAHDRQTARHSIGALVGPTASNDDPLIRSQLALSVASQFLAIVLDGASNLGDINTSYFSSPRKLVVRSATLVGGSKVSSI